MTTVRDRVLAHLAADPAVDTGVLVKAVLDEVPDDGWRHEMFEVVRHLAEDLKRGRVRHIEARSFAVARKGTGRQVEVVAGGYEPDVTRLRSHLAGLLDERFKWAPKESVSWRDATVEQHEARIRMQSVLQGRVQEDIDRHREAIAVIRATGCQTLGEALAKDDAA